MGAEGPRRVRHPLPVPQPRRLGGGRHCGERGSGRLGHARQRLGPGPKPPVPRRHGADRLPVRRRRAGLRTQLEVDQAAWEATGGTTEGTNGTGLTIYGELGVGKGRVRFLGALLPDPTEAFYHPYGLQNYAVTYTGYTLLQNMLKHSNPSRIDPPPGAAPARRCRARKPFRVRVTLPRGTRRVRATINGRRVRVARRRGRAVTVRVRPAAVKGTRVVVRLRARTRAGRAVTRSRTFRLCRV